MDGSFSLKTWPADQRTLAGSRSIPRFSTWTTSQSTSISLFLKPPIGTKCSEAAWLLTN